MKKINLKDQIAVALKYDKKKDVAPKIIASGKGYIATKIKEEAERSKIPQHKDIDLAEELLRLDIGEEIPQELYEVVATIFMFVKQLDEKR